MNEFNHHVKNGYAYRKTFPGATVQDLAHYCLLTLRVDQPDVCVINIGCNNLDRDTPHDIYKGIINIVNICHHHGVNDVYVSAIPLRIGSEKAMADVNNFLRAKACFYDYFLIDNSNIQHHHISRDSTHLNYNGTILIANNFLKAINGKLSV